MGLLYTASDGKSFLTETLALVHDGIVEELREVEPLMNEFVDQRYPGKAGRTRAFNNIREWEIFRRQKVLRFDELTEQELTKLDLDAEDDED